MTLAASEEAPVWPEVNEDTNVETLRQTAESMERYFFEMESDDPARYDFQIQRARVLTHLEKVEFELAAAAAIYPACLVDPSITTDPCVQPTLDYELPELLYRELLAKHDGGPRAAEINFYLGQLAGHDEMAVAYYQVVVADYFESAFRPAACAALGDVYYAHDQLQGAREAYQCAIESSDTRSATHARWRQGWISLSEGDPASAATAFQFTIVQLAHATGELAEIRQRCLDDLVVAFANMSDGWSRAENYYASIEGSDAVVSRLQQIVAFQTFRSDWPAVLAGLSSLRSAYPDHPNVVTWGQAYLHAAYADEDTAAIAEREERLVLFYGPEGDWVASRMDDPSALLGAAALLAEISAAQSYRDRQERRERRRRRRSR